MHQCTLSENVGKDTPMKNPKTIPRIVVITILALSFDRFKAPLPQNTLYKNNQSLNQDIKMKLNAL